MTAPVQADFLAVVTKLVRHKPISREGCKMTNRKICDLTNTVHNTDCIKLMQSMPDGSVDMVFADPPFNLNKKYNSYKDNMEFDEYLEWTKAWTTEACRILSEEGSFFIYNIPKLLLHTAPLLNETMVFRHWIAWNSGGKPLGKTLQPAHYGILFYTKTKKSKFYDVRSPHTECRKCGVYTKDYGGKESMRHPVGYQVSDVWNDIHRVRHKSKRVEGHPCQLPVHLIERMVLMTTDEDDIVFDPFSGGGSAGVATMQMGRRYIGTEMDKGYCLAGNKKLRDVAKTKGANGEYVSLHLGKVVSVRDIDCE